MKIRLSVTFVCLLVWAELAYGGSDLFITRNLVRIRDGAGSYYEVVGELRLGEKVKKISQEGGWYKIKTEEGSVGWISKNSVSSKKKDVDWSFADSAWVDRKVSSTVVTAVTKGFERRYAGKHGVEEGTIERVKSLKFSPEEFEEFVEDTFGGLRSALGKGLEGAQAYPDEERETVIGAGVAVRLASFGLYEDEDLNRYVSLVGTLVAINCPRYDISYRFNILDMDEINGFSAPGGYIFVTTGALKAMENEVQLAGFLGHEIAHIVQMHGMEELRKQRVRIGAEELFEELEEEVGPEEKEWESVISELEDLAEQMFQACISGRSREDENEADILGLEYAYRAGYDPWGLRDFLHTIMEQEGDEFPLEEMSFRHHLKPSDRIARLESHIRKRGLKSPPWGNFERRYQQYTKALR